MKHMSDYKYHFGLKVRIYPNTTQKKIITASSNASRFVYNKMVEYSKEISAFGKPSIYIKVVEERIARLRQLKKYTTALKDTFPWLCAKEIDNLAIENAKQNYQKAWNLYWKVHGIAPPNYHKKSYEEKYQTSAQYDCNRIDIPNMINGRCKFSKKQIKIPFLGIIRYKGSSERIKKLMEMPEVRIGTITITKDGCDDYYASFQLASDDMFVEELPKTGSQVGIDLNIRNFLADNEGNIVDNPHYFRRARKRLAKVKRKLGKRAARAKKENRALVTAKNYQKQRKIVAKITRSVMNRRRNFLHIQSRALINNNDLVVAEELRSKNMVKNHALASSIYDSSWRTFLNMMTYKSELYGRTFKTVNPRNTTQTCSNCGHILKGKDKLTLNDDDWTCPICREYHHRDVNAAKNILAKGLNVV